VQLVSFSKDQLTDEMMHQMKMPINAYKQVPVVDYCQPANR